MTKLNCYVVLPFIFLFPMQWSLQADDHIPAVAWRIPIGQPIANPGHPEPVAAGNLDDGFWQGAPVGGFGAGPWDSLYRSRTESRQTSVANPHTATMVISVVASGELVIW
jgi:non-lysosomal glucosylceramidase